MHLEHGLRIQATGAVDPPRRQQVCVEGLEVLDPEPTEWDVADTRHDAALDAAAVAVPGARPQTHPLGGQPLLQEVAGEAGSTLATSPRRPRRELAREPLRRSPVVAGRLPAAPLPTGQRIDPLVDHCVEAATLRHDVSAHDCLLAVGGRGR